MLILKDTYGYISPSAPGGPPPSLSSKYLSEPSHETQETQKADCNILLCTTSLTLVNHCIVILLRQALIKACCQTGTVRFPSQFSSNKVSMVQGVTEASQVGCLRQSQQLHSLQLHLSAQITCTIDLSRPLLLLIMQRCLM